MSHYTELKEDYARLQEQLFSEQKRRESILMEAVTIGYNYLSAIKETNNIEDAHIWASDMQKLIAKALNKINQ